MADAQASGACGSNIVWVQVPSPASFFVINPAMHSLSKTAEGEFIHLRLFLINCIGLLAQALCRLRYNACMAGFFKGTASFNASPAEASPVLSEGS